MEYQLSYGQIFGLVRCVPSFNLLGFFFEAIGRRVLLLLLASFLDDSNTLDLKAAAGKAQNSMAEVAYILGFFFFVAKRQVMAGAGTFFGVTHEVADALRLGVVKFGPKESIQARIRRA